MNKNPELLYHYTNQEGLLGIIKSQSLWATKIHYLNDAKEIWHAFDTTRNELQQRHSQSDDSKTQEKLNALQRITHGVIMVNVYICSFSEKADALSQWRSYVGEQPGFALGFNFRKLADISQQNGFSLYPCIYKQSEQSQRLGEIIDSCMTTEFDTRLSHNDPKKPFTIIEEKIVGDFINKLADVAPLLKHQAFEDEREWRLISDRRKSYQKEFRSGKSMVAPYVEIKLNKDNYISCLERVVVGPSSHQELALSSIRELFDNREYINPKPEVISSEAPFRYW